MSNATSAAFLAHNACKGIVGSAPDVGEAQTRGVELVCTPHAAHERQALILAPAGEDELLAYRVNGVNHIVWAREGRERRHETLLREKGSQGRDLAGGVYVSHDARHDLCLGLAYGALVGDGLSVDVAGGHHITIHEHKRAHAAPRERLCAVGAYASQAHHHHAGRLHASEPCLTHDQAQAVGCALLGCALRSFVLLCAHHPPLQTPSVEARQPRCPPELPLFRHPAYTVPVTF